MWTVWPTFPTEEGAGALRPGNSNTTFSLDALKLEVLMGYSGGDFQL